jgi:hypothetical protein
LRDFLRAAALAFPTAATPPISPRLCGPPTGLANACAFIFGQRAHSFKRADGVGDAMRRACLEGVVCTSAQPEMNQVSLN